MPHKKAALFYFYNRDFNAKDEARDAALDKIRENY
jgi:hypothetical protein